MKAPVQMEDEGIVVAFGDAEEGGGMPDVRPLDALTQVDQSPAPAKMRHKVSAGCFYLPLPGLQKL